MKKSFKHIILLGLLFSVTYSRAQMMQKLNDAYKIKEHEAQFIGKPLKDLLKEIKPPIKMAVPFEGDSQRPPFFSFRFVPNVIWHKYMVTPVSEKLTPPLAIMVRFQEKCFVWDRNDRSKEEKEKFLWTKKDVEQYGNLIIASIDVYGQTTE